MSETDPLAKWKWTPETVIGALQGSQRNMPFTDLADAHNAAIEAAVAEKETELREERERFDIVSQCYEKAQQRIKELEAEVKQ